MAQLNGIEDQVRYGVKDSPEWPMSSVLCQNGKAKIQGLKPGTKYIFMVYSSNHQVFLDENCDSLEVETDSEVSFALYMLSYFFAWGQ
jgi:hypothetical protein